MTDKFTNFAEVFLDRAALQPNALAYRFHMPQSDATVDLRMGELARRVKALAAGFQSRNLQGQRVVLALPHSPDFIYAFFACLAAGAIAVPVPQQRSRRQDPRLSAVIANAEPGLVLVDAGAVDWVLESIGREAADIGKPATPAATIDEIEGNASSYSKPLLDGATLAVLQYTSGSTGEPKGVMITHGNMIANCRLIQQRLGIEPSSTGVLWLPFYHDMGLVGAVLLPMFAKGCIDLMSPQDFLRAPISWLQALSKVGATTTAAPNFALELCCELATPETIAGLDLSNLRCLLTGSEPVNPNTIERFAATFASTGFRYDAFLPAYGLAEATLLATGTLKPGPGPTIRALDVYALANGDLRPPLGDDRVLRLVGNGAPSGLARIVDPETARPLGEGLIGEIWLTGPSIAKGYWNQPDLSEKVFGSRLVGEPASGPYYRTGDLGFVLEDDLFITGRSKDLIIVRGRNIYPQDVEEAATREQPLLWTGAAAAIGSNAGQGEEVVLIAEAALASVSALRDETKARDLVADMLRRIADMFEVTPAEICIIRPGRLPRTSSGKIRRGSARQEWETTGFSSALIYRWVRPATRPADFPEAPVTAKPLSRQQVEDWLLERLAHHSGQPKHQIDLDEPFSSYGLDSMTAIEMIEAINRLNIGDRTVDPVDLYDYPTIARLLDHMFASDPKAKFEETAASRNDELDREAAALRMLLDD